MPIDKIQNIAWASLTSVSGHSKANIASISGISAPSGGGGSLFSSSIYTFDDQQAQTGPANDWAPSTQYTNDGWVNGASAVDGSNWTGTTLVKGWNCDTQNSPSGQTGPAGAMTSYTDGTITLSTLKKYLYKECTSGYNSRTHILRTPGYNFSTLMDNTSNNLDLIFWIHGYGSAIPNPCIKVWVDTATTSNATNATLINSVADPNMANANVAWQKQTVSLNSYRTVNSTHYFYFEAPPASNFRGDVGLESLYFIESTP